MQIKDKIKDAFGKNRRQKLTSVASLVIVNVLVAAGVFAYFSSSDAVTNRLSAEHSSVALIEPAWDSKGGAMAHKSEPGMNIPKNPKAKNDSNISEYCRISMTVTASAEECIIPIVHAICMSEDVNNRLMILNDNFTIKSFGNSAFAYDNNEIKIAGNKKSITYYFYYVDDSGKMQILQPDEETPSLFEFINIPVYKADYYGVFDRKYYITLQAEAVPAVLFEDGTPGIEEFREQLLD